MTAGTCDMLGEKIYTCRFVYSSYGYCLRDHAELDMFKVIYLEYNYVYKKIYSHTESV